ncbi:MAG: hypothetical protein JST08_14850 [Actinobacteria bacterium]|nr:hypothetical protein [Actinomycetota bacterium]
MSEHTDDQVEDEEMTRVIETDAREDDLDREDERWVDSESRPEDPADDGGCDDYEPIAPRPRGRLLRPVPLALMAVTIAAAGFLGGVLAQKGSEGGGGVAGGPPAGLAALATGGGATEGGSGVAAGGEGGSGAPAAEGGAEAGAPAGLPSFGTTNAAAAGTVTAVEGHTIYVKEADGTVVAVKAGDGSSVTRDANVAAKKVHPGDTVVVEGSKHGSTVKASSIAATESGVESSASATGATDASSVESLFGE